MSAPRLIFLAGPNGAGKSTFYELYLREILLEFINPDRIKVALGISIEEAAALADALRNEAVSARRSFITETVFSDPVGAKLHFLREAVGVGYEVHLIYIGLSSAQLSEGRVFQRVQAGGHDVPTGRLERRFRQSLKNLAAALAFVPNASVFDNSSDSAPYQLVLAIRNGGAWIISRQRPL